MKLCALLIVAAVCAVLLPSDVVAGVASPSQRAVARRSPLEVAKRQLVKREDSEDSEDDEYDVDVNSGLAAFFASDFVTDVLERYGVTMEEIDEIIDSDEEIEPEERPVIKAFTLMIMAGVDGIDSSEEDSSMD